MIRRKLAFFITLNSYVQAIVSGIPPLLLPKAKDKPINSLIAYGGTEQRNLPEGYTELEYIENTGTQYIDTGITDIINSEFELVAQQTELLSGYPTLLGAMENNNLFKVAFAYGSSDQFYTQVGTGSGDFSLSGIPQDTNKHTFKLVTTASSQMFTVDTTSVSTSFTTVSSTDYSLFLFARNRQGTVGNQTKQKVYSFKAKKNGILIADYIPAKRKSDNVIGMYDTVTQTFFTNAGTGDFIAGAPVEPELPAGYVRRNFIYMMNGSYLQTDLVPTYNCKIEMVAKPLTADVAFCGGRTGSVGSGILVSINNNRKFVMDAFGDSGSRYEGTNAIPIDVIYKFVFDNKVGTLYQGDTVVDTHTFTGTDNTGAALAIKGRNDSGTIYYTNGEIYLYSFRMYDNTGVLVADYIPAVKLHPLTVGFYDTVSGTFKTATAGTFAAGTEYTPTHVPTPDTPMDIWCNNGVLKGYVSATGSSTQDGTPTPTNPVEIVNYTQGNMVLRGVGTYLDSYDASTKIITRNVGVTVLDGTENISIFTSSGKTSVFLVPISATGGLGNGNPYTTYSNNFAVDTQFATSAMDDNTIWQRGDNALQFFIRCDTYDNNVAGFKQWLADQYAAGTPVIVVHPLAVSTTETWTENYYADGMQETIGIRTRNLFDDDLFLNVSGWSESGGVYSGANNTLYSAYGTATNGFPVKVKPATQYVLSYTIVDSGSVNNARFRIYYTDSSYDDGPLSGIVTTPTRYTMVSAAGKTISKVVYNYTSGSGTVSFKEVQLEEGTTATDYIAYNDSTAVAEMLLKIDSTYTDEQEIIDGTVTHKVGVKVLDGTENWQSAGNNTGVYIKLGNTGSFVAGIGYCTHSIINPNGPNVVDMNQNEFCLYPNGNMSFKNAHTTGANNTTVWANYLAAQYAAGTPIIVVYALTTSTTESVTAQPMSTTAGDNIAEITQASIDNLQLQVTYYKGA